MKVVELQAETVETIHKMSLVQAQIIELQLKQTIIMKQLKDKTDWLEIMVEGMMQMKTRNGKEHH